MSCSSVVIPNLLRSNLQHVFIPYLDKYFCIWIFELSELQVVVLIKTYQLHGFSPCCTSTTATTYIKNECFVLLVIVAVSLLPVENSVITDCFLVHRRRLDGVVFKCSCEIRWIQLWLQRGEASLHTQELYCNNGVSKIRLRNMHLNNCGEEEWVEWREAG